MRRVRRAGTTIRLGGLAVAGALLLAGCGEYPGVTVQGKEVSHLYNVLFFWGTVVFVLVEGLILFAVIRWRRRDDQLPPQFHGNTLLETAWTIGPLILVASLAVLGFQVLHKVDAEAANPDVTVNLVGFQWQWSFTYQGVKVRVPGEPAQDLTIKGSIAKPPDIYLPVGKRIHFNEQSKDVIHSFYIPEFLFKRDVFPDHVNHFEVTITKPGAYHGQCAQYCGIAHNAMHFTIHAVSLDEYQSWLARSVKQAQSGCPADTTPGKLAAKNTAFDKDCLSATAGRPFTLAFDNQEGVPHNVAVFKGNDAGGQKVFTGQIVTGPRTVQYQVGTLQRGSYFYHCDVHPTAMTGKLVVR
jgi:cytochrome c oxidase subunit II